MLEIVEVIIPRHNGPQQIRTFYFVDLNKSLIYGQNLYQIQFYHLFLQMPYIEKKMGMYSYKV